MVDGHCSAANVMKGVELLPLSSRVKTVGNINHQIMLKNY